MMTTIVLGDTHGRDAWKKIVNTEEFDRIIFIGDYFDSYDIPFEKQGNNFLDIIEYKKSGEKEVILLFGNHDYHYLPGIYEHYSGFQHLNGPTIGIMLKDNLKELSMAYTFNNILFTHAGVTNTFLKNNEWGGESLVGWLNDLFHFKPLSFFFNGWNPYGDDISQSPIWVRPRSLMQDSKSLGLIQIVGHTQQNQIDIKGKSTGGKYYFIDTLGTSKEFLIITDEIKAKKYE